jgi:glycine dehydrogenase
MPPADAQHLLRPLDTFARRHIGPDSDEIERMLRTVGPSTLDDLVDAVVPGSIRMSGDLDLPQACGEREVLAELCELASRNEIRRSYLGLGYHGCVTPGVILRNILENPGWYTQYTPYQAEISQGRLEALLNFQTMTLDLTGMEVANSSLLDEATAAAEAMTLCRRVQKRKDAATVFFVADHCHPQTIDVVRTRARPLGIEVVVGNFRDYEPGDETFGALVQYPATDGSIEELDPFCEKIHAAGALVVVASDLLSLLLLRPPGEFGADVVVGNTQRFGMPMAYGGPHAAFMAARDEFKRMLPGRIVGVSRDVRGDGALRLALQTREQHIRREKATSNICTAQVLPAIVASMYAVYHGPEGLRDIARRVHRMASMLDEAVRGLGYRTGDRPYFDTVRVLAGGPRTPAEILQAADARRINLRRLEDGSIGVALDETVRVEDLRDLFSVFGGEPDRFDIESLASRVSPDIPAPHGRRGEVLTHPVFRSYRSETEMLRYIKKLEERDLSLTMSMIPLGSCTMKLNATTEMIPITWPGFAELHPFVPVEQAAGYRELFRRLEAWCAEITGFAGTSLQPNAGSQGEYTGLLVIRAFHASRGEEHRDVCLIPESAHGTNPASAVLAGMEVVVVACDREGNIDLDDLRARAREHRDRLAAIMVTYPSTHGVFEESVRELCEIVHDHGGQVYLDGANMNALVGLCRPGEFGADVCHLNLHKTFCIPHGGGGPGMGPICVAEHLLPFLPGHPLVPVGGEHGIGPVSAAPWGSPAILPISYAYIAMMGAEGLRRATQVAVLNANYIARRLHEHFPVLYRGKGDLVAHECILDLRFLKSTSDVDVNDVAKRLIDYGFHAPTMSWPVHDTLMVEPTESESLAELDRFCEAMIAIREEIREIERGEADPADNLLKGAPHTAREAAGDSWSHPYSRERAAFPTDWTRERKFWPPVARIDNVYGDRHLVCACPPLEAYSGKKEAAAPGVP